MIKVNFKLILDYFIEMYEIFIIEKKYFWECNMWCFWKGKYDNKYNKIKI